MIKKTLIGGLALAIISLATIPVQASHGTADHMNDHGIYHHGDYHRQMILDDNMTTMPGYHSMECNMTEECRREMNRWENMYQYGMNDDNMTGNMTTMMNNFRMGLGPQHYGPFDVDVSDDPFVNPRTYRMITGMPFVDENGDGICDIVQDTEMFRSLGIGPCVDENEDSICDCFQTKDAYERLGMHNFVDVDGDGICDNYEMNPFMDDNMTGNMTTMMNNFRMGLGPQHYGPFDVDVSDDPFVNPRTYRMITGMPFVDENGDGICDIVQDTEMFRSLGIGPCVDENEDSICDCFQTKDAYERLGMHNFVDVDGDGICDNYEMNPFMDDNTDN